MGDTVKVLQVGKFYYPIIGGVETVAFDITEMLNRNGVTCDVLCTDIGRKSSVESFNGYNIYRAASLTNIFSTSISLEYIFILRNIIEKYDIIHIHLPNPLANIALLASKLEGKKVVLHWHSDIIKQKKLLKLYRPLRTWLLKRADAIIGTSEKYISESEEIKPYSEKCIPIPIGIDDSRLQSDPDIVKNIKEKYKNKKIILSLGRHVYYKGFEYLISAASLLDEGFVVLIGGDGPLRSELQKQINAEGLESKVYLVGKIPNHELGSYFEACDIFCLPSILKSEAFGVVQIEAMSFGKPIVATNIKGSGTSWVNQHGVSGLNVEIRDPIELSQAICAITKNEEVYSKYSLASKARFNNIFKREVMFEKIKELYDSLSK